LSSNLTKNTNPIIICTVEVGGQVITKSFDRTTPIREVKRALKIEYKKLGNKSKNIDKEIVFYCDGKPMTDEDEQIGNIADDGEINLAMLSVSLNDSSMKDNYKIQEKLINKLASNCKFHSGNKELLICVTCGMAICDQCGNNHEGHEKLYKTELINSGRELNRKSQEINNIFMECGFSDTKGNNNLCKEEKQRINMNIDNIFVVFIEFYIEKCNIFIIVHYYFFDLNIF